MTAEQWRVVDEDGAAHDVAVDEGRGPSRSWWAATPDVARRSHASARAAVVLVAQACEWRLVEVLAPGQDSREELADEVAHLEARRGALLAEVDRLTAALAAGRIDGARAALPKAPVCECGAAASGTRYVGSGSDGPHRTPCCRAHGGETYEVARG